MEPSLRTDNLKSSPEELRQQAPFRASNLTWSQWLLWHEQHRRPAYLLSPLAAAFVFSASLDSREFRQAFQTVVDRSDALRTVFVDEGGVPQRYVLPRLPLALDIVDLSAAYQPAAAYEQWRADRDLRSLSPALRPFDSTLVRLGDQHYVWRLALHRLIADNRSLLLLYKHTADAYAAALGGTLDELPPLPPFEHFAVLDRQWALGAGLPEGRSATRAPVRFPVSLPVGGERFAMELGKERTMLLRRAAADLTAASAAGDPLRGQDERAALFLLLAAGLAALLARLRGCRTICIDTDIDLRTAGLWQETVGRISRPQLLTVEVTDDETFAHLLRKLAAEFTRVQQHPQHSPTSERPLAACRALLQLDETTFPPFAGLPVKVERLDTCFSQRRARESKIEPAICLAVDGYNSADNLRAGFTLCGGHLSQGRGAELAQEYIRLLDALVIAREQPLLNSH
jgi:hypothetical protein